MQKRRYAFTFLGSRLWSISTAVTGHSLLLFFFFNNFLLQNYYLRWYGILCFRAEINRMCYMRTFTKQVSDRTGTRILNSQFHIQLLLPNNLVLHKTNSVYYNRFIMLQWIYKLLCMPIYTYKFINYLIVYLN